MFSNCNLFRPTDYRLLAIYSPSKGDRERDPCGKNYHMYRENIILPLICDWFDIFEARNIVTNEPFYITVAICQGYRLLRFLEKL